MKTETRRLTAAPPRMPALAIVVSAALAFLTMSCGREANEFVPPPPPAVTVAHPIERPVTQYLMSTGTTEAFQTVDLRARVGGFLEQVLFKPGAEVKTGDLLFVIDRRTYQAAVDRVEAQVLSDEAAYQAAASDARIAEELATQRAGSEIDKITKIGIRDSAAAAVVASKAELANARLNLEFTEVRAPIDGRITKNFVDIGNLVGAGGEPTVLATVVSTQPIYVTIDASESDLWLVRRMRLAQSPEAEPGEVAPGVWREVDLATADSEEFNVHGHIDYVDPTLDPGTGTIRVRCRFENEDNQLLPGLFVRLRVFLQTEPQILVPDIALLSDQNGRYALVVTEANMVEARRVTIGTLDGTLRVVLAGLDTTDRIVVNGLQRARPGVEVVPTVESLEAPTAYPPANDDGDDIGLTDLATAEKTHV